MLHGVEILLRGVTLCYKMVQGVTWCIVLRGVKGWYMALT